MEESNYYPFGLKHKGYNNVTSGGNSVAQKWGFQGQEIVDDLGLNVHEWKFRIGDPAIGRFWQIDPLAEDYVYNGTYNFAENKVIDHFELEGLEGVQIHTKNDDDEVTKITYKLDVYYTTGTKGDYSSNFSSSQFTSFKKMVASIFGGSYSDPDSGVDVVFDVTVKPLFLQEVKTDEKGKKKLQKKEFSNIDVMKNLFGKKIKTDDGIGSIPAIVVGQKNIRGTDGGKQGVGIKVDSNSNEGFQNALGHELLHFMLGRSGKENHSLGGGLGRPIKSPFINNKILKALKTYVPTANKKKK
mgnify:CR=1 FL=1